MDHLTATEKQITWAAVAVVFLSIYALATAWGALLIVPLLTGLAALVILFLPRIAPNTKAPGSKGSLLMVSGVLAAAFWLLAALTWLNYIFRNFVSFDVILFLIGLVAALVFGWLCWQAFQAEGGKFQFGNTDMGTTSGSTGATTPPPAEPAASAPPAAAPPAAAPPPAAPPPAAPPPAAPPPAAPASPPADTGMGAPPPSSSEGDEENRV